MRMWPASLSGRLAVLCAAGLLAWLLGWFFDADRGLRARQELLLAWAQSGGAGEFLEFAADDYEDQWGHTPADVVMLARAGRLGHPDLKIVAGEARRERSGDEAQVTQRLTVTGAGERVDCDFYFTWRKQSIWPWGWKLRKVTAPEMR